MEAKLGMEVLGVERRRRWTEAAQLGILAEVNTNGWTLVDSTRRMSPFLGFPAAQGCAIQAHAHRDQIRRIAA